MLIRHHLGRQIFLIFYSLVFVLLFSGCAVKTTTIRPLPGAEVNGIIHHVRKGQTLWRIARVYGVGLETLARVNRIADKAKIKIGQRLIIPGAKQEKEIDVFVAKDSPDFIWPVQGDIRGFFNQNNQHWINKGIDIGVAVGTDVLSARPGVVSFSADNLSGYGKTIIVRHRDGFITVYAHNLKNLVSLNQHVGQGEIIAKAGRDPRSGFSGLHFQIRRWSRARNPLYYLLPPEK